MAITRAQQAKQMLREGGRIGLFRGALADTQGPAGGRAMSPGTSTTGDTRNTSPSGGGGGGGGGGDNQNTQYTDRIIDVAERKRRQDLRDLATRQAEDKAQEPFETLIIKDSNFPGFLSMGLNALKGPRQKLLNRNVDFFRNDPRTRKAREKYGLNAQGYKDYMSDRLAGIIDAAGNPLNQGDNDDNNMFLPVDTTFAQAPGNTDQGTETKTETEEDEGLRLAFRADGGRIGAMDGGMMSPEGGIMDLETGRQMYFLGKLVKKATRAVKKVAKSPIGKAALLYAGAAGLGAFGAGAARAGTGLGIFSPSNVLSNVGSSFLRFKASPIGETIFGKALGDTDMKRTGGLLDLIKSPFGAITAASVVAGLLTPEQEDQAQLLADNTGIDIEEARNQILNAAKNQDDFRARAFKADGGIMRLGYQEGSKEPVAKKTMPLLDMGGKEMDLREDGGFVPIGRMEKADDVPARLSKNEFVFTADAVRNAGDGNVDKGAEVMYNMMKNLESGGDVSEESQGLEGARRMFQTSQRLEEVL